LTIDNYFSRWCLRASAAERIFSQAAGKTNKAVEPRRKAMGFNFKRGNLWLLAIKFRFLAIKFFLLAIKFGLVAVSFFDNDIDVGTDYS